MNFIRRSPQRGGGIHHFNDRPRDGYANHELGTTAEQGAAGPARRQGRERRADLIEDRTDDALDVTLVKMRIGLGEAGDELRFDHVLASPGVFSIGSAHHRKRKPLLRDASFPQHVRTNV